MTKDTRFCAECGSEYDLHKFPSAATTADGTGCVFCNPDEKHEAYRDPHAVAVREGRR